MSVSLTLGENGILTKSQGAVNKYDSAYIEEQLKLAQSDYQIAKKTNNFLSMEDALDKTDLDIISINGNDDTGYEVKVNTRDGEKIYKLKLDGTFAGVPVKLWVQNGNEITNSKTNQILEIGQKVNYNEGTGYSFTTDINKGMGINSTYNSSSQKHDLTSGTYMTENLEWRVLGINTEGQIELVSEKPHSVIVYIEDEEGFCNGAGELDKLCDSLYGKGMGAVSSRNLKITDINKLANYDPALDTTNNPRYNTYRKYRFTSDSYEYSDSEDGMTNWSSWKKIPSYYGINRYIIRDSNIILSKNNPGETEPIKHTYYGYDAEEKIANSISAEVANLIYSSDTEHYQWISSDCTSAGDPCTNYGLLILRSSHYVELCGLYSSNGNSSSMNGREFCPVVTLKPDIKLNWNSVLTQWEIQ